LTIILLNSVFAEQGKEIGVLGKLEGGPNPPELAQKIKKSKVEKRVYNISCFPLETMLAAVDNPVIDYFSLDVEGFELKVR